MNAIGLKGCTHICVLPAVLRIHLSCISIGVSHLFDFENDKALRFVRFLMGQQDIYALGVPGAKSVFV